MHRDRLSAQKDELRAELLETRRARDGLLADRAALQGALAGVRASREALLAAYADVEGRLTGDAVALKGTLERALDELDGLHREISRKRGLSAANEQAADIFLDGMTGQLRGLLEAVFSFRDAQSERHAAAVAALSELDLERESHASAVQTEVRKLSHATVDVLTGLAEAVAGAEIAAKARSLRLREDVR
jgi:hypothetical protein